MVVASPSVPLGVQGTTPQPTPIVTKSDFTEHLGSLIGTDVSNSKVSHMGIISTQNKSRKGIIYYTDNRLNIKLAKQVRDQIKKANLPIVSASLKPLDFGKNIHIQEKRGYLTMFKQILAALEASDSEIIYFCEHDVLYHPSHFEFTPPKKDVYYYNVNVWKTDGKKAIKVDDCKQTSGLVAYRDLLIRHYRERIKRVEESGFTRKMGFEPGTHNRAERVDDLKAESYTSEQPNLDIRHDNNLTQTRWSPDEFRDQRYTKGWTEGPIPEVWQNYF
jgi:hypothetical protein